MEGGESDGLERVERVERVGAAFLVDGLPLLEDLGGLPTGRGLDVITTAAVLLDGRPRVLGVETSEGDTAVAARDGVDDPTLAVLFLTE